MALVTVYIIVRVSVYESSCVARVCVYIDYEVNLIALKQDQNNLYPYNF